MFDIGWGELVLIGIVALIAIGPKELPGALRTLGQWTGKIRRMAGEFQQQFQEAMREAELADIKKEFDDVAAEAAKHAAFDPIAEMRQEVETVQRQIESAAAPSAAAIPAPNATPAPAEPPTEAAPSVSPPAEPSQSAHGAAPPDQRAAPAARGDAA
jgi:sec-independent protein translocase protein TatB